MNKITITPTGVKAILIIASLVPLYLAFYLFSGDDSFLIVFEISFLFVTLMHFYYGYKSLGQRYSTNYKYPESRCKECQHLRNREYGKENRTKLSKQRLVYRRQTEYGVSEEDYNAMVLLQNNLCAICNKPSHRTLHVDHDHKTGRVRGLLCYSCNTGIGLLRDDINYLANAIKYLTYP